MAQIINLGQFGQQRDSALSGLGDAIGKGITAGTQIRAAKAKEAEAKIARKAAEAKEEREEYNSAVTQATLLTATFQQDPGRVNMFLGTEPGKVQKKFIQKHLGQTFDDQDNFVGLDSEQVSKNQRENLKLQDEQQLALYQQKINSGKPLTDQEATHYAAQQKGFQPAVDLLMKSMEYEGSPYLKVPANVKLTESHRMAMELVTGRKVKPMAGMPTDKDYTTITDIVAGLKGFYNKTQDFFNKSPVAGGISAGLGEQPQGVARPGSAREAAELQSFKNKWGG